MKPAARLAGVLGACCAALLVIGLILLYANGFTTIMTFNHPGAGYEFAFVDVLARATFARSGPSNVYLLAFNLVIATTFTPVGVLIASRNPRNSLGWLFCAVGLSIGLLAVTDQYAIYSALPASGSSFAEPVGLMGEVAGWLASWIWCPEITFVFTLLPLLFPDGRPLTRRWWVVVWLAVLGQTLIVVYLMFLAGPFNEDYPRLTNPFGVPGATAFLELCLGVGP